MITDTPLILGAHASALMKLRVTSLAAYGIDPRALVAQEGPSSETRALAKTKREERALAIQEDHNIVIV